MLYVTTRDNKDAYTAPRTLASDCGPDGGRYLPFRMPRFSGEEIASLKDKSFGQTMAQMLNLFFGTALTGWDVEFVIGRYPVKINAVSNRILAAELWRNLDGSYEKMERHLAAKICGCGFEEPVITSWLRIAIRVSTLFAVFGELQRQGLGDDRGIDIAVSAGDFTLPMAVWYAREMGLNVGNIILGCGDTSCVWDLLHNGQMRSSDDQTAAEIERLVYGTLGLQEAQKFAFTCAEGGVYSLRPDMAAQLRKGMFSAVVSANRMTAVIPNVYRTNSYILEPDAAVSYGALMDFRAKNGAGRCALLLADRNPRDNAAEVAAAMNITQAQLKELLK